MVHGHVEPGFEKVADAFADNFEHRGDSGAACAVYRHGLPVVDIWAGDSSKGQWTAGTRSVLFSVSKGVTTICLLMAREAGLVDLDAPVVSYWPEYGQHGKAHTTVRHLLAHQGGLLAPDRPLTLAELREWKPVVDQLASQAPLWGPGSAYAYHALTFGWLVGEVLHRATGQRPQEWLRDHVAQTLGLNVSFGADAADPEFSLLRDQLPITAPLPPELGAPSGHEALIDRAMTMTYSLGTSALHLFHTANTDDFLSVEIPAGNFVSSARDLARLYGAAVSEVDGVRLLERETVDDAMVPMSFGTSWLDTSDGNRWGSGFMLSSDRRRMLGPSSFGHDGAGGQLGFADLQHGIGFGYQTIRPGGYPDDRAEALCDALRACL